MKRGCLKTSLYRSQSLEDTKKKILKIDYFVTLCLSGLSNLCFETLPKRWGIGGD